MTYPHKFLGRCATCLDNAYMSAKPCPTGYGQGMPLRDDDCCIRRAQAAYRKERGELTGDADGA